MDEREGDEACRSAIAGTSPGTEAGGWCGGDGGKLSAKQAAGETVSGGRSERAAAPQRGRAVAPSHGRRVSGEGVGAGTEEVWRGRRGAIWTDAGGGASGIG